MAGHGDRGRPCPIPASTITGTQMKVLAKKAARLGLNQEKLAQFADGMGFYAPVPQTQDEFSRLMLALDTREARPNTILDPIVVGATSYGDARIAKILARVLPESFLDMAKTANRELMAGSITQVAKMAEAGKEMARLQYQVMQRAPLRIGSMRVERMELLKGFDAGALEALRLRQHRGISVMESVLGKGRKGPLVKTSVSMSRIERADNAIRSQFDEIIDEAVVHGFMERNRAGKDIPVRRRQNYLPVRVLQEVFTNVFKKKQFTEDAVELLVKEGDSLKGAKARVADFLAYNNPLVKRNAHLEFSRSMNLPDKWIDKDYIKIVNDYFESAVIRLEEARAFGDPIYPVVSKELTGKYSHRTVSYPLAEQLLNGIGDVSQVDQAYARKVFETWAGLNRSDPGTRQVSSFLRSLQAVTKLSPMTGALNMTQTFTGIPLQGSVRSLTAALVNTLGVGGKKGLQLKPEALLEAIESGAVIDRTIDDLMSMSMGEGTGRLQDFSSWYLDKIVRLRGSEIINRTMAAQAGKAEINGLVRRLMKNNGDTVVRRQMEKLNVSPDEIIERNGLLTRDEELRAMQEFSRKVNFTGDLRNNPFQAITPGGKVVYQFKNFSMNQAKLFTREFGAQMLRSLDNPQEARKMAEMIAKLPILGATAGINVFSQFWVRRMGKMLVGGLIFNETVPEEDKAFMHLLLEIGLASATGSYYDAYYSATHGIKGMVGFVGGPTVQTGISVVDVGVNRPGTSPRFALKQIPTLGKFVPSEPRGSGRTRPSRGRTRNR